MLHLIQNIWVANIVLHSLTHKKKIKLALHVHMDICTNPKSFVLF